MRYFLLLTTMAISFTAQILCAQYPVSSTAPEQPAFQWPEGKKMALSLTFDDARFTQPDKGIPLLDKYGVKATFYVSPTSLLKRVEEWKRAAKNGHDIGNHSITHPCSGNFSFSKEKALENYSLEIISAELDSASRLIKETVGIKPVSFAYPCGQTFVGRGLDTRSYIPLVAAKFETGRGWMGESPNDPAFCDMAQLIAMPLDGKTFDQIMRLIDLTKGKSYWLILAGHEMDEVYREGALISTLNTIEAICKYASDPANGIWIDNVHNIASYINERRRK